jgi:hypothetical protein
MTHYCLRAGNKWTIPELITLHREYELLELTVQEIAQRHKRSVFAIVARLESECLVENGDSARGYVSTLNEDVPVSTARQSASWCSVDSESDVDDDDDEDYKAGDSDSDSECDEDDESEKSDVNKLSDRVWNLETSVNEIGGIVKQMMELMSNDRQAQAQAQSKSRAKRVPLRGQKQSIEG